MSRTAPALVAKATRLIAILAVGCLAFSCLGRGLAAREDEPPVPNGEPTLSRTPPGLCGRTGDPPAITPDSLGPLRIGALASEVRAVCKSVRDTSGLGAGYSGLVLDGFGSTVVLTVDDDGTVLEGLVLGGTIRTAEGFGHGSTFAELRSLGPRRTVALCGERPASAQFGTRPGITFVFELCRPRSMRVDWPIPDSTRVIGVGFYRPAD